MVGVVSVSAKGSDGDVSCIRTRSGVAPDGHARRARARRPVPGRQLAGCAGPGLDAVGRRAGAGAGRCVAACDRHPALVLDQSARFQGRDRGGGTRRQARDGLFRPGWMPLLQGADEGQFRPRPDHRQDTREFRRHRHQHLGRCRGPLDRWQHNHREGTGAHAEGAVHADAALLRDRRHAGAAPQRLPAARALHAPARLRDPAPRPRAVDGRVHEHEDQGA